MKKLLYLIATILCISCGNENNIKKLFPIQANLKGETIFTEPNILAPIEVFVNGTSDVLITEPQSQHFAAIIDNYNGNKLVRICPIGRGPGEYIPPLFFSKNKKNNSVSFFSPLAKKFYSFNINHHDSVFVRLEDEYYGFENSNQVIQIDDSLFLSTTINSTVTPFRYNVYKRGKLLYSDKSYPENKSQEIPNELKSIAFQAILAVNPSKNLVVSANRFCEHIEILKVDSTKIETIYELHTSDIIYENSSLGNFKSLVPSPQNRIAFLSIDATNDYIYVLYSGRTFENEGKQKAYMGNTVLKFNWNGKPLENITLDRDIINFSINENIIYAIGIDSVPKLFSFKM